MTTFAIKLIAVGLMVLDHIAAYLLPDLVAFRVLGRLSFPLFAWLIANGYQHTSNANRYLMRLLFLAIISQGPYVLANNILNDPFSILNIFFTLALGLLVLMLSNRSPWPYGKVAIIMAGAGLASLLPVEYGVPGLLSMVAFYYTFNHLRYMFAIQLVLWGGFYTLPLAMWLYGFSDTVPSLTVVGLFQPVAALSVGIIALYNHKLGRPLKYAFYLFYPAHLLALYWLRLLIR